ncbi:MAG: DMT family transporter [Actinobacteria bacterium]|nr:DMT family transporter [Actinomycetota bacterium]
MRGYIPLLLVLAAIWGSSFMFIKVAVDELAPTTTMAARLVLAAVPLVGLLIVRHGWHKAWSEMGKITKPAIVLGGVNTALPFTLIAWGETKVDSGVAAIANASVPIFVAALAIHFRPAEKSTGLRLFGIMLGLAGVAILAGFRPEGGWWGVAGTMAVVVASFAYATGTMYTQTLLIETENLVLAAASIMWGAILLLPFGLLQAPSELPGWKAVGSVAALAILGTVIGQLLFFRLIFSYGSARAALVVYLLPVTALFYGALLLDETIKVQAIVGLALILVGTALGSGVLHLRRRREVVATAP